MCQSRENLRTDGRTDGQTLLYQTLPAETGGPKRGSCEFGEIFKKTLCYRAPPVAASVVNYFYERLYRGCFNWDLNTPLKVSEICGLK